MAPTDVVVPSQPIATSPAPAVTNAPPPGARIPPPPPPRRSEQTTPTVAEPGPPHAGGNEHGPSRLDFAAMEASLADIPQRFAVRPWIDPVVESSGHDPHSRYVELFWLGVLGPTATWLIRRFADGLEMFPDGYELDLYETAQAIGLSAMPGKSTAFVRAMGRCVLFGMADRNDEGFDVRRKVPSLELRHLRRLPEHLRVAHAEWHREHRVDDADRHSAVERQRAEAVAEALLRTGDDPSTVERRLSLLGVQPNIIVAALRSALGNGYASKGRIR